MLIAAIFMDVVVLACAAYVIAASWCDRQYIVTLFAALVLVSAANILLILWGMRST